VRNNHCLYKQTKTLDTFPKVISDFVAHLLMLFIFSLFKHILMVVTCLSSEEGRTVCVLFQMELVLLFLLYVMPIQPFLIRDEH